MTTPTLRHSLFALMFAASTAVMAQIALARTWPELKQALASSSPAQAREAYLSAWRYYGFGAWPTQNSPENRRANDLATSAFRAYAGLANPTIEVLRIPFEGKEIIGYLQRPAGVAKPPVKIEPGVERLFSRVIDALQSRSDIDPDRIGFQGGSWGGHWSARVAYAEPTRLKAVVNWGGPVHAYFQRDWQLKDTGC